MMFLVSFQSLDSANIEGKVLREARTVFMCVIDVKDSDVVLPEEMRRKGGTG